MSWNILSTHGSIALRVAVLDVSVDPTNYRFGQSMNVIQQGVTIERKVHI